MRRYDMSEVADRQSDVGAALLDLKRALTAADVDDTADLSAWVVSAKLVLQELRDRVATREAEMSELAGEVERLTVENRDLAATNEELTLRQISALEHPSLF